MSDSDDCLYLDFLKKGSLVAIPNYETKLKFDFHHKEKSWDFFIRDVYGAPHLSGFEASCFFTKYLKPFIFWYANVKGFDCVMQDRKLPVFRTPYTVEKTEIRVTLDKGTIFTVSVQVSDYIYSGRVCRELVIYVDSCVHTIPDSYEVNFDFDKSREFREIVKCCILHNDVFLKFCKKQKIKKAFLFGCLESD